MKNLYFTRIANSVIRSIIILFVGLISSITLHAQTATIQWAKALGGSNTETVEGMVTDGSGNVYTTGMFGSTADFDPDATGTFDLTSAGGDDVYISKLDASGNFVWAKQIGGNSTQAVSDIALDDSYNVYVTGYFLGITDFDPDPTGVFNLGSSSGFGAQAFVAKYGPGGDLIWARSFGTTAPSATKGEAIRVDLSGNIYTTGSFTTGNTSSPIDFDPDAVGTFTLSPAAQGDDIYVQKLDQNGIFQWAKQIGGYAYPGARSVRGLTIDLSGRVIVVGELPNGTPLGSTTFGSTVLVGPGMFVSKLDSDGSFMWAGKYGDGATTVRGLTNDNSGNLYVAGNFSGTINFRLDFDPGAPYNLTSTVGGMYISKLDGNGIHQFAKQFDQAGSGNLGILYDQGNQNILVTSTTSGTTDLDPDPAAGAVYNVTAFKGFFVALTSNGVFVKGTPIADSFVIPRALAGNADTFYTAGLLSSTVDFDPSSGTYTVTPVASSQDAYVEKMTFAPPTGPTITNFSPGSGPLGTTVTITGTNFSTTLSDNIVQFNGTTATVTGSTATSITTSVPSGASTGTITVTIAGVTATSATNFIVTFPPTITNFTPPSGPVGTTVTINGANFSTTLSDNVVQFNGTTATVTGSTTTSITTSVPSGASTGTITVTIAGVTATSATNFTVTLPLPTISNFTPPSGSVGTTVTINGTNFSTTPANNTVRFNGTLATVSASTSASITTTVPPGATTGTITVFVGGNTATSATNFTVTLPLPTISNFTPASGSVGTTVTINGTNFSSTPVNNEVRFNGTLATVSASNTTSITTTVPAGATTGSITVLVGGNTATSATNFIVTLPLPTITSFTPVSGPIGASVTISGTNFSSTPANNTVRFNGTLATVSASTATAITTTVPSGATSGTITVLVGSNTATSATSFTVTVPPPLPTITSFTPANGLVGASVIITGTNFDITAVNNVVRFNGTLATVISSTATNISTTVPVSAATGLITVTVGSNTATSASNFIVNAAPTNQPPQIKPTTVQAQVEGRVTVSLTDLLSDPDNNLDFASLRIVVQPLSGARAAIDAQRNLVLDYSGILFSGTEKLTIEVCDLLNSCAQKELSIEVVGDIIVYNAISPNGDGKNDLFIIKYIDILEQTRQNHVSIYNRWGDLLFDVADYNNKTNVFKGLNNNSNEIPSGIYFYKLQFVSELNNRTGYLEIRR